MNVLVTGGTGFIGRHLVAKLMDDGHNVRCLVRDTSNTSFLRDLDLEIFQGDVTKSNSLKEASKDVDIVYHLAAIRGEHKNISKELYYNINVLGTKNLLDASCKSGVDRFVYCSTVGVIGWISNPPASEMTTCNPSGNYHITKYEGEKLVNEYFEKGQLKTTIVRPVITYGDDKSGFILNLSKSIKSGFFRIMGDGNNCMHLAHISNMVSGLVLAMEKPKAIGQTYIIADESPITINKLVEIICNTLSVKVSNIHIPVSLAEFFGIGFEKLYSCAELKGEPLITIDKVNLITKHRFYDISNAKNELGYMPVIDTEDGIRQTVEFYKENGWL